MALRLDSVEFDNRKTLKKIIKKYIYKIFNRTFDYFFAIGSLTKKFLFSVGIPENKISTFSYVIDNEFFREKSKLSIEEKNSLRAQMNIPEDEKVIISVAKFSERESPWDLLKALASLKDFKIHLLLVGDGPERKKLEQFSSLNLTSKVTFAGYIKYPELPKYYGISDAFVHTSSNEPWGVSVHEAIASGLPVIASDKVGAAVDLIHENKNGFIYKTKDMQELSLKIKKVLFELDPKKVNSTNQNILKTWNYDVTFDMLFNILKQNN